MKRLAIPNIPLIFRTAMHTHYVVVGADAKSLGTIGPYIDRRTVIDVLMDAFLRGKLMTAMVIPVNTPWAPNR
jgi:hypothetical protein